MALMPLLVDCLRHTPRTQRKRILRTFPPSLARAKAGISKPKKSWPSGNTSSAMMARAGYRRRTGHIISALYFSPAGVRMVDRTDGQDAPMARIRYRGVVRGAAVLPEGRDARSLRYEGNRVELDHAGGVTEWYVNAPVGLEHGFTLNERLPGTNPLRIVLDVDAATVEASGGHVQLVAGQGHRRLNYAKLVVEDAEGQSLPARMERLDDHRIALVLADEGARYPLVVDPLFTVTADTLVESNQPNAHMGFSVAGAGDVNGDGYGDVIVGAHLYDNGQVNEGAAFLYLGSSTGLATTSSVQLESNQAGANLGWSVAGAGATRTTAVAIEAYLGTMR